ncbi:right-handed parallel beta-helix repeat-containing protein [Thalassoglobus sp. JC818]|uniref:beta strand repeat-containing protein n=1 Tax=Thalassoglobus sp. JC818 TaxID=3232136 RepID=UPI00345A23B7
MKDTCKSWLQVLTACLGLSATSWAQIPELPGLDSGPDTTSSGQDYGSVRMGGGDFSASAVAPPQTIAPTNYHPDPYGGTAPPMFADSMVPSDESVGFAMTRPDDQILFRVGRVNIDQYGIQEGFTNINAFIPTVFDSDRSLWWLNPRVNITDSGEGTANVGLGYRTYIPEDDRVYGASMWWDYEGGQIGTYHSLGGSFESIGRFVSMRFNFDLPIGTQNTIVGISDAGTPRFDGNNIVIDRQVTTESALQEYDFEIATPMPLLGDFGFDVGVGVYYLKSDTDSTPGVSLRTQAQVTRDFYINGILTNDDIFDTNFSLNFELTLPGKSPAQWFRRRPVSESLTASVLRRYRVPVNYADETISEVAMSPIDPDKPISIAIIDPNKLTPGTGSFSDPFMSVLDYESQTDMIKSDFDLIFVRARTDETDTNLNTTISLFDNQALLGDGGLLNGTSAYFPTSNFGMLQVPGATTGPAPLLTNSGAPGMDVITLADSNYVANFNIDAGMTADGIAGVGIDGFELRNLNIDNAITGIDIISDTSAATGLTVEDFGFIGNTVINGGGFGSNEGISIVQTAGTLDLLISENEVSGFLGEDANENGILDSGEDVDGDTALDSGAGISVVADGGTIVMDDILAGVPTGMFDNLTTGNTTGIVTIADNGGTMDVALIGNESSNNVGVNGAGWLAIGEDSGSLNINFATQNIFRENAGDGVRFIARDMGSLISPEPDDLTGTGFVLNTITDNGGNGVQLLADNAVLEAFIGAEGSGNTISRNGSVQRIANIVDCVGSGVLLTTMNGGVINGAIDGNVIRNNVQAGIQIAPDMGLVDLDSISGNIIVNTGFDLQGNPYAVECEDGDALVYAPSNGGTFNVGEFIGNTISNNRGAIIRVGGDGGIIDLGVIEDTVFDLRTAGTAGILFDADNATITGVLRNNMFIGSTTNADLTFGVGGEIRGGTLDLVIEDNLFDSLADAGIGFILTESDDRPAPGTGTPAVGDAVEASLIITGNQIISTRVGDNDAFDGSAISLHVNGRETDSLFGQNDFDGDGVPDATTIPLPDGSDVTTTVQPAAILEAAISGNLIGDLDDIALGNAGAGIDIQVTGDGAISDLAAVSSTIDNPILTGMIIGEAPGTSFEMNIIANNQQDGIRVRREDSGIIDNFRIDGNVIQNNQEDGIDIVGENNGIPYGVEEILDFEIHNNQILSNGFLSERQMGVVSGTGIGTAGRGIQLRADAGVVELFNISNNIISGNRMGGIEARTFTDTHIFVGGGRDVSTSINGGDEGIIYGTWELNTVTDNGYLVRENENGNGIADLVVEGHGIALGRVDFMDPDNPSDITEGFNNGGALVPDFTGDGVPDLPLLTVQDNVIAGNAEDGLHIYLDKDQTFAVQAQENRTTRINILRNDIVDNGEDGLNVNTPLASNSIINVDENLIARNGVFSGVFTVDQAGGNTVAIIGDGIEIFNAGGVTNTITVTNNRVLQNNGRGVNILNSEVGYLVADFDRNNISSNEREGFYMVNAPLETTVLAVSGLPQGSTRTGYTADSWLPDFDSNHEMYTYGRQGAGNLGAAGNTVPDIIAPFMVDWVNNVIGPGSVTDLTFTSNIVDNNGGVVADADGEDNYSTLGGFVMRTGTAGTQDTSPTSVPIPFFTGGVRAEVADNRFSGNFGRDFMLDGFVATEPPNVTPVPDPLIRIDLQFRNNRGGSIDVSGQNFSVFYNNTAPALAGGNQTRPNPPFNNAGVLRDATVNLGLVGALGPFPGFGTPTLRIEADGSAPDAFGNFIGNNEFNLIYSDFNFDWLTVPVGTLPVP